MVSVLAIMDQEQRFKTISMRHSSYDQAQSSAYDPALSPSYNHGNHTHSPPHSHLAFDHDTNSSLLDMQYQQQLESIHAAQVSDHARQLSPGYNTASSPSTSSVDIYLEHPSGFASHMESLTAGHPPLQGEPWSPDHHFTHLLDSQEEPQSHHRHSAPRPLSLLSQSAPAHDTLFDYPFPSTPSHTGHLEQSPYVTSPTRSTALCAELDNINIADVPDTYGTSIDSAASSSYSFGLQTPPIAAAAPIATPSYKSPALSKKVPEASQTDEPTPSHTAQKPPQKKYERRRRRRESHNAVERKRREHINDRIQELGSLLPNYMLLDTPSSPTQSATGIVATPNQDFSFANGKPSKATILSKSVDHIRDLQSDAISYKTRIRELEDALRASNQREAQWNTRMVRPSSRSPGPYISRSATTHVTAAQYNQQQASTYRHRPHRYRPRSHTDPQSHLGAGQSHHSAAQSHSSAAQSHPSSAQSHHSAAQSHHNAAQSHPNAPPENYRQIDYHIKRQHF
ncbi:hypothetical protein INT43_006157 [Umbelopsis isabellina]|uniref:BHLH domain-containing protein n=1 Tax=Mortierella isabellina TaxID=91625 RepID=A0A8H7PZ84_MORIS|nr:hypothetical protein INT43_006157 [Umbelopsis isabellina]